MKTAIKSTLAVAATAAAIAGVAAVPAMVSAFSRPLYSYQYVNEHDVGVTFNSIKLADTDAAWAKKNNLELPLLTNETNFVGARLDTGKNEGAKNVWEGTNITAEDGKTYIVRLYVHNNSQKQEAKDVQVRFHIPYASSSTQVVDGWLHSSNATPKEYLDDVTFKSVDGTPFHLEYVSGSALLENGGFASGAGVKLSDTITNHGNGGANGEWTTIGYNTLDGVIPGCYKYINYVSIRVKAVYDYDFTIEKQVRISGDTDKTWKETVEAKVGDKVEFQLTYKNTSDKQQNNVKIRDVLPKNLRYVENSTKLKNSTYPNGANIVDGKPSDILQGINIGNYAPGANAKIMFTAEVVDNDLACGSNTLVNWGQAGVGDTTIQDYARVHLTKVCENTPDPTPDPEPTPTPELPNTGPEMVAGGVIATGSIATAAGYYIASRRQLR